MKNENRVFELIDRISELRERARYLSGKKRGAWGLITDADRKRNDKIYKLEQELRGIK